MVIDNADDLSTFRGSPEPGEADLGPGRKCYSNGLFNYIPRGPFGSVFYTTRNKVDALELTSEGWIIQVTEMNTKDLKTLLQTKMYDEIPDEEQCADLINNLGRLPLAIVQAASYSREAGLSRNRKKLHCQGLC
ncbi:hypothetical protein BKA64DRAFT_679690 [Cadophora sp. MPI-SDFR-AT-0126]|nr:hypothetical protein BKA64DRAFT_679690 [Leotiomycetes sp. MPI-SDFR-AT-0126]